MTKKHFIALASILASRKNAVKGNVKRILLDEVVSDIADYCQSQNSKFNRATFLAACNK